MAVFVAMGPDPDGDFFVIEVEINGEERDEVVLDEAYASLAAAQKAADQLNGDAAITA